MRRLIIPGAFALIALGGVLVYRTQTASHPTDDLGSDQPLALGTSVALEPNLDAPAVTHSVAAGAEVRGRITVRTLKPGGSGRPTNGGRVQLEVTATLDAHQPIALNGQSVQRIVIPVETPNRADFSFTLPPLAPGHHCVAVGVLENAREYIEGRPAIDHLSMTAIDFSAGQGPEHCVTSSHADGQINDDLPIGCDIPLMTNDPGRARYGGVFKSDQPVWALVPSCANATSVSVMLHHDGLLVTKGKHAPFTTPSDGHNRAIDLGPLPRGSWRIAIIASDTAGHSVSYSGPAVLID